MTWAFRRLALTVGAAALLSAQAAYAAPAPSASTSIDPLVSLSMLGSDQSRAAVCGTSFAGGATACAVPAAIPASSAAAAAAMGPDRGKGFGTIGIIIGLALVIGLLVAITSGGDSSEGNLPPLSPA